MKNATTVTTTDIETASLEELFAIFDAIYERNQDAAVPSNPPVAQVSADSVGAKALLKAMGQTDDSLDSLKAQFG